MRSDCIQAVTDAAAKAGRTLTSTDLRGIEQRIRQAMRDEAVKSPEAWQKLSPAQQVQQAAERAAKDIEAGKQKNVQRVAQKIIIRDKLDRYVEKQAQAGMSRTEAIYRLGSNNLDARTGAESFEQVYDGVANFAKGKLTPLAEFTNKYAGFWTDKKMLDDVHSEIWGEDTGNAVAKKAALMWNETIAEPLRQQSNEVGADIGKLPGGYDPQVWDMHRVASEGFKTGDGVYKFIENMRPLLSRDAYRNIDGSPMNDIAMNAMLGDIRQTLATGGASKGLESQGTGGIKNRGSEHRVLHFKDAASARKAFALYGRDSLMERMSGHVEQRARHIAAMKMYSADAPAMLKSMLDEAEAADARAGHDAGKTANMRRLTETQFKMGAGLMEQQGNPTIAHKWQVWKTAQAMAKLGTAPITAIGDSKNIMAVAQAYNMPTFRTWGKWESLAWRDAEFRRFMRRQGSGVQTLAHGIARFGEDVFGHGTSAKWANTFFRVTGLNFEDTLRRNASDAVVWHAITDLTRDHETMATLSEADAVQMRATGVDDKTWAIWRAAKTDETYGFLCPDTVMQIPDEAIAHLGNPERLRRDAAQELVGHAARQTNTVVPMLNLRQRAIVEDKLRSLRGSHIGELARSVLQFKSFPIADFTNHMQRMRSLPSPSGKALYLATVYSSSLVMGAMIVQIGSLLAGNNPQDMTDSKFWARALVKGGGLNLYLEALVNYVGSPYRQHVADQLGPTFSLLEEAAKIGEDLKDVVGGEKRANTGGDIVRLLKGNSGNIWYLKAVLDHLIFQRLQDFYSPGYAQRLRDRTQKYYNSGQWWQPSTAASPSEILSGSGRGITQPQQPDLNTALGGH